MQKMKVERNVDWGSIVKDLIHQKWAAWRSSFLKEDDPSIWFPLNLTENNDHSTIYWAYTTSQYWTSYYSLAQLWISIITSHMVGIVIIPIWQMSKLRLKEINSLPRLQSQWLSQDLNPGRLLQDCTPDYCASSWEATLLMSKSNWWVYQEPLCYTSDLSLFFFFLKIL